MLKTFAEDLKAIREEKNISLRDIANKTRLNISILENLETGEYNFQPQAYIRAFMKQYLAAMDLDVDEILFEYDLARSGKYKSKRQNISAPKEMKKEEMPVSKESKLNLTEKLKEMVETPKKKIEEKISEKPLPQENRERPDHKTVIENQNAGSKSENVYPINPNSDLKAAASNNVTSKNPVSLAFLSSPLVRNIVMILIAILVLIGLYSLINILFLEGGNNQPEVIRQNFDDVIKEQERKLLGKRTPEEIQDSIRRAGEEIASSKDSITLKIISSAPGIIFLVKDSANFNKPLKIEFGKNETGVFRAAGSFYISSTNTETFKLSINDTPLKFNNKSVSKAKITKDGIIR